MHVQNSLQYVCICKHNYYASHAQLHVQMVIEYKFAYYFWSIFLNCWLCTGSRDLDHTKYVLKSLEEVDNGN